jgi:hypothetical protein
MIAQAGRAGAGDLRARFRGRRALGRRIRLQAVKRAAGQIGLALGHLADELQEQWQRPWCVFMLQCTRLR